MAENLTIVQGDRTAMYTSLIPQIKGLTQGEANLTANLANIAGALKQTFDFFWVGFYWVDSENELVLGPFQGPIACTRIIKGKGVCGTAWATKKSQLVPDVDAFPGHIACSAASKSEVVIPILDRQNKVVGVLDVDSDQLNDFSAVDIHFLEVLAAFITELL